MAEEKEKKEPKKEEKSEKPKKVSAASVLTKEEPDASKKEAAKAPKKEAKKPKQKHKHTHIEHLDDGSHVIRHTPKEGGDEVAYSAPDMAGLHAGLDANLGNGGAPAAGQEPPASPAPAAPAAAPAPAMPAGE